MDRNNDRNRDYAQRGYDPDYGRQRQLSQDDRYGSRQVENNYDYNTMGNQMDQFEADGGRSGQYEDRGQRPMMRGRYRDDDDFRGGQSRQRFGEQPVYDTGGSPYAGGQGRAHYAGGGSSFNGNVYGGHDFVAGAHSPYGGGGMVGRGGYAGGYGGRGREDDRHDRGFLERAGDEVASWFGDDDAARRREMDHRGAGPQGYQRSDERILEDVCDRLTDDPALNARNVTVTVNDSEVTLDGTVPSRRCKRRAEDCADHISGVTHVQNNLRVDDADQRWNRNRDTETTG